MDSQKAAAFLIRAYDQCRRCGRRKPVVMPFCAHCVREQKWSIRRMIEGCEIKLRDIPRIEWKRP